MTRYSLRFWLSITLVVCTACGGEESGKSGLDASTVTPDIPRQAARADSGCPLLTKAEAQSALGSPIEDFNDESRPTPIGTMLRSSCYYEAEDGSDVTVTVDTYESASAAAGKFETLKNMYRGARAVPGVGEDAFADREVLVAKQGPSHVMVKLRSEGANKITDYSDMNQMNALLAVEQQIAGRAIARLPALAAKSASVASSRTSGKSVCSIIPKTEMESILGGSLTHAVPADSPRQTVCLYTGAGGRYAEVSVEWQGGESGMDGARLAGALMGQAAQDVKVATPVPGLGDEAMMLMGGVLNVRKGPALITVDLRMQEGYEAKARIIAQKVLASM